MIDRERSGTTAAPHTQNGAVILAVSSPPVRTGNRSDLDCCAFGASCQASLDRRLGVEGHHRELGWRPADEASEEDHVLGLLAG